MNQEEVAKYEQFSAYINNTELHPLTAKQIHSLGKIISMAKFTAIVSAAVEGNQDAIASYKHYADIACALTLLNDRSNMTVEISLLDTKRKENPPRFKSVINDINNGSVEALQAISHWNAPVVTQQEPRYAAQVQISNSPAPIHQTQVNPPTHADERQHVTRPAPAAVTAPTTSNANTNSPPREQTGGARSNVVQLPQQEARNYDQVTVFGGKTALSFDHSPTPDRKSTTINISLAKAKKDKCTDGVDWQAKIMLMLTPKEVALIAAVFLGQIQSVRFAGHGSNNEKWIEVAEAPEGQYQGTIKVTMAQGKDIRNCSVTFNDILEVISIFNRALISQHTGTSPVTVPQMTARVSNLYQKAQAARESRRG